MTFKELSIIEPILKALKAKDYEVPTPIQAESIPVLLQGKDILGSAQTGTGKTAAFAIPILQNLYKEKYHDSSRRTIKALVLAPTRELALQIHDNFKEYGKNLNLRTTVIYGGVPQSRQVKILNQGVDILVATPGRLLDLIQQRKLTLADVSYLVLDEADRMLDMGFVKDVKKIVAMVKKERQTMFFSATMPNAIMSLASEILNNPVRVMVTPEEEMIDKIKQSIYFVDKKKKIKLLSKLLLNKDLKSVLVFSRTKHGANRIVQQLEESGFRAKAIHGNKSQTARQKALTLFKTKQIRVLVATDIAARGIDVDELSHVINYDLPEVPETYIHRIGRTGRAGLGGVAISFCSQEESDLLNDIQKHLKMKIDIIRDSVYSIVLLNIPAKSKSKKSTKSNKPSSQNRPNRSYSRKRTKGNKVEPKNFSKHDSKNQTKRR
jgi:ATP-dependent RNA helicase RhlE